MILRSTAGNSSIRKAHCMKQRLHGLVSLRCLKTNPNNMNENKVFVLFPSLFLQPFVAKVDPVKKHAWHNCVCSTLLWQRTHCYMCIHIFVLIMVVSIAQPWSFAPWSFASRNNDRLHRDRLHRGRLRRATMIVCTVLVCAVVVCAAVVFSFYSIFRFISLLCFAILCFPDLAESDGIKSLMLI